jgi:hypothetical protein
MSRQATLVYRSNFAAGGRHGVVYDVKADGKDIGMAIKWIVPGNEDGDVPLSWSVSLPSAVAPQWFGTQAEVYEAIAQFLSMEGV